MVRRGERRKNENEQRKEEDSEITVDFLLWSIANGVVLLL